MAVITITTSGNLAIIGCASCGSRALVGAPRSSKARRSLKKLAEVVEAEHNCTPQLAVVA